MGSSRLIKVTTEEFVMHIPPPRRRCAFLAILMVSRLEPDEETVWQWHMRAMRQLENWAVKKGFVLRSLDTTLSITKKGRIYLQRHDPMLFKKINAMMTNVTRVV